MSKAANAEAPRAGSAVAPRRAGPTARFDEPRPVLSVIVPVYNEAATVDALLGRVLAAAYAKQVIVVDDGSTDATAEVLERWRGSRHVELLRHPANRGKGAAIRTALERAEGRFTVIQDADLEYDPQDYPRLIEPLLCARAEAVYGSRRLGRGRCGRDWLNPFYHGVSLLNLAIRLLYGVRLTDEATCYKAFPTALLRAMDLQCERFEFCPEVTAKACRLGARIVEVPIRYDARSRRAGKKIRWRDGLAALMTLWRWRRWRAPAPPGDAHEGGRSHRIARETPAQASGTVPLGRQEG